MSFFRCTTVWTEFETEIMAPIDCFLLSVTNVYQLINLSIVHICIICDRLDVTMISGQISSPSERNEQKCSRKFVMNRILRGKNVNNRIDKKNLANRKLKRRNC